MTRHDDDGEPLNVNGMAVAVILIAVLWLVILASAAAAYEWGRWLGWWR